MGAFISKPAVEQLLSITEITSSVASVEIAIPEGFHKLRVEWDLQCVSNASAYNALWIEFKTNGTWRTSNYEGARMSFSAAGLYNGGTTNKMEVAYNNYGTPEEHIGQCHINNVSGLNRKLYSHSGGNGSNGLVGCFSCYSYTGADSTMILEFLRFSATTNLNGGKIRVYGVAI